MLAALNAVLTCIKQVFFKQINHKSPAKIWRHNDIGCTHFVELLRMILMVRHADHLNVRTAATYIIDEELINLLIRDGRNDSEEVQAIQNRVVCGSTAATRVFQVVVSGVVMVNDEAPSSELFAQSPPRR